MVSKQTPFLRRQSKMKRTMDTISSRTIYDWYHITMIFEDLDSSGVYKSFSTASTKSAPTPICKTNEQWSILAGAAIQDTCTAERTDEQPQKEHISKAKKQNQVQFPLGTSMRLHATAYSPNICSALQPLHYFPFRYLLHRRSSLWTKLFADVESISHGYLFIGNILRDTVCEIQHAVRRPGTT